MTIRRHVLKFQYDRLTVDISYTVGHVYMSLCSSITHFMLSNIYTFGFEYCKRFSGNYNLIITAIRYTTVIWPLKSNRNVFIYTIT